MWQTLIGSLRPYDLERIRDVLTQIQGERYEELKSHLNASPAEQDYDMTANMVTVMSLLYKALNDIHSQYRDLMGDD